jgi:signal peptidase I
MNANPKQALNWALTAAGVVAAVICVRTFIVASYRISTPAMETTLSTGDCVLVDKLARAALQRNHVFLFTSPLIRDRRESPLIVSRCAALPGDTIEVSAAGYKINGRLYPLPPTTLADYTFSSGIETAFLNTLQRLNIPIRNLARQGGSFGVRLAAFEEYRIREELIPAVNRAFIRQSARQYSIILPRKGDNYPLNENIMPVCRDAILAEAGSGAEIRNNKLYIDNREQTSFRFARNYYWALSDHIDQGIDSRRLGLIPDECIVGRVRFCWYSPNPERRLKTIR